MQCILISSYEIDHAYARIAADGVKTQQWQIWISCLLAIDAVIIQTLS